MSELDVLYGYYETEDALKTLKRPGIQLVRGEGVTENPILALVGEAPGPLENAKGKPFQGKAGLILNNLLKSVEIDREMCYLTNAVKYQPVDSKTNRFRKPTDEEIKASRPYLLAELEIIKPTWVCILGNSPLKAIFPHIKSLYKTRGELLEGKYFVTYHPSYLQYSPDKRPIVEKDFRTLAELIKPKFEPLGDVPEDFEVQTET